MKYRIMAVICALLIFVSALPIAFAASDPYSYEGMTGEELGFDVAWCQLFANQLLSESDLNALICDTASCTTAFNFYSQKNLVYFGEYSPIDYDLIYFDFEDDGIIDHVGVFYEGKLIEGNYQNSVRISDFNESPAIYCYVHPFDSPAVRVVSPVDPGDTSGLKSIMLSLLGPYDAIVEEYAYQSGNGYTSYVREIQPDYVWMISAAIFAIVLYSVFRLIGLVFKKGG